MNKLEIAKKVIAENIEDARCGIFNTRNFAGDDMSTIYNAYNLVIDICYLWEYFEVFGLTEKEFEKLKAYYKSL